MTKDAKVRMFSRKNGEPYEHDLVRLQNLDVEIKLGSVDIVSACGRTDDFKVHRYTATGWETDASLMTNYLQDRLNCLLDKTNTPNERLKTLDRAVTTEEVKEFMYELCRSDGFKDYFDRDFEDNADDMRNAALKICEIFGYFNRDVYVKLHRYNEEGWRISGNWWHARGV